MSKIGTRVLEIIEHTDKTVDEIQPSDLTYGIGFTDKIPIGA